MPQELPGKLRFVFLLQALMASVVIVLGAWAATVGVEHEVARHTLQREAEYFWMQRAGDPAHPAPDGRVLHGYAIPAGASAAGVPESLRSLPPGLHEREGMIVLVDDHDEVRLYLTYAKDQVDLLALELVAVPVLLALLAVAASSWFSYRVAHGMVTPLHWLAHEVRRWDPLDPATHALAPDTLPGAAGL
jgi:hypothetical protein